MSHKTTGGMVEEAARSWEGASRLTRSEPCWQRLRQAPQRLQLATESMAKGDKCIGQPAYWASGTTQSLVVQSAQIASWGRTLNREPRA